MASKKFASKEVVGVKYIYRTTVCVLIFSVRLINSNVKSFSTMGIESAFLGLKSKVRHCSTNH